MLLYHVSRDLTFEGFFYPRIPSNVQEGEDVHIPRICFTPSIEKSLSAMPNSLADYEDFLDTTNVFYRVYVINSDDYNYIGPEELYERGLVRDAFINDEYWVTDELNLDILDSFLIAVLGWDCETEDLIPYDIYTEAMEGDGDYLGLYIDRYGSRVPFTYTIRNLDYFKISNDLSELIEVDSEFMLPDHIINNSWIPDIEDRRLIHFWDEGYNDIQEINHGGFDGTIFF